MISNIEHIEASDVQKNWSNVITRVQAGEQFIVTRNNCLIAKLVPPDPKEQSIKISVG